MPRSELCLGMTMLQVYVRPQYQLYYAVVWVLLVLLGVGPKCEPHPGRIFDILLIKYSQAFFWQGLWYIQF